MDARAQHPTQVLRPKTSGGDQAVVVWQERERQVGSGISQLDRGFL